MALIDEEIIQEWLISRGFLTIRGLRKGNREIDLLGVKSTGPNPEYWHIESQVSFKPIGHIGGGGAARQTKREMERRIQGYIDRKFNHPQIVDLREKVTAGVEWKKGFVYAVAAFPYEIECFRNNGVHVYQYREIIRDLIGNVHPLKTSSDARNIVNIIGYFQTEN